MRNASSPPLPFAQHFDISQQHVRVSLEYILFRKSIIVFKLNSHAYRIWTFA